MPDPHYLLIERDGEKLQIEITTHTSPPGPPRPLAAFVLDGAECAYLFSPGSRDEIENWVERYTVRALQAAARFLEEELERIKTEAGWQLRRSGYSPPTSVEVRVLTETASRLREQALIPKTLLADAEALELCE